MPKHRRRTIHDPILTALLRPLRAPQPLNRSTLDSHDACLEPLRISLPASYEALHPHQARTPPPSSPPTRHTPAYPSLIARIIPLGSNPSVRPCAFLLPEQLPQVVLSVYVHRLMDLPKAVRACVLDRGLEFRTRNWRRAAIRGVVVRGIWALGG
ncbi:hypothetical protein MMC32_004991 [Xylographa parallela]|nr:hypothetical protein [Xylographa parallela]